MLTCYEVCDLHRALTRHGREMDRTTKVPGSDHPITIERNPTTVTVKCGGTTIARSRNALTLREATYSAVQYIHRGDVDMTRLRPSADKTYCPYKGDAPYFDVPPLDARSRNAVWSYETPFEAVQGIAGHVAFYPDRFEIVETRQDE